MKGSFSLYALYLSSVGVVSRVIVNGVCLAMLRPYDVLLGHVMSCDVMLGHVMSCELLCLIYDECCAICCL